MANKSKSNNRSDKGLRDEQGRFTSEGASVFGQKGGERTQINRRGSQKEGRNGANGGNRSSSNRSNDRSSDR